MLFHFKGTIIPEGRVTLHQEVGRFFFIHVKTKKRRKMERNQCFFGISNSPDLKSYLSCRTICCCAVPPLLFYYHNWPHFPPKEQVIIFLHYPFLISIIITCQFPKNTTVMRKKIISSLIPQL